MAKYLAIIVALAGASLCQASDKVLEPLTPIKKPAKAEKKADVDKVTALLKLGIQDKKDAMQRLKRGIGEGQPFAEMGQRSLRELSRRRVYFPTLIDVKKGEIGVLRDKSWYSIGLEQFDVMQVIDDENMLIKIDDDTFYWLSGFSTDGLSDDDTVQGLEAVLEVVGTKKYNTAVGTKTVPWIKPFPLDLDLKPEPKAKPKAKATAKD